MSYYTNLKKIFLKLLKFQTGTERGYKMLYKKKFVQYGCLFNLSADYSDLLTTIKA